MRPTRRTNIATGSLRSETGGELQKEIEDETGASFKDKIIDITKKRALALNESVLDTAAFAGLWNKMSPKTEYRLEFDTDEVVDTADDRTTAMPPIEPVKFRISKAVLTMDADGLGGTDGIDLGEAVAESARRMPDVAGDLCRRLPLSRATIVRILKEYGRVDEVNVNPAVFSDQGADAISRAVYETVADGITYATNDDA